jgi:hypothetical protein
MHGPGTSRPRDAHGARNVATDFGGIRARPRRLDDWRRHVRLPHLLECAAAQLIVRRWTGDEHDGRFGHQRRVERRHRVCVAGAAGDERDADFALDPRPGVGHVHGGRLVPRVQQSKTGVERRVEHRHDVVAGQREHVTHAAGDERTDQGVGAAHDWTPC